MDSTQTIVVVIDGVQRVQSGHKIDPRRGRIVAQEPDASQAVLNTAPQSSSAEPAGGGR